jgi:hypothetical protein
MYKSNTKLMKLSKKIKLEYWQAVTTGMPHGTLESMLSEALDKMEDELQEHKIATSSSLQSQPQPDCLHP